MGIIVPTGIATDDSNKLFFGDIVETNRLVSLFDFENREAIFPSVHRMYKFSLLTVSGSEHGNNKAQFGFSLTKIEHLKDNLRIFSLSKQDFIRLNPNTKTCPIFRTTIDAKLTSNIYQRVPVFINEKKEKNVWGATFMRMFDMSNDSFQFETFNQLLSRGATYSGNSMILGGNVYLPLYESKMLWLFNHRYGSYDGVENRNSTHTPTHNREQYENPKFIIKPWYWVEESIVRKRTSEKYFIGFRRITNSSNERTFVNAIVPLSAVGDNTFLVFTDKGVILKTCLSVSFSSLVFDMVTRQKLAGLNMNFFYVEQFPVLPPETYTNQLILAITPLAIELYYSSWDIKAYADDLWKEADEPLRTAIKQKWEENKATTGGHEWAPPEWCEIDAEGCPLPPFKWDENRRAVLKAELDAIYAKLYGLTTEELRYILDPQDVYGPDFPGETFRVLKEKEIRLYGEYRTRRLVLEAWEKLNKPTIISLDLNLL